MPTMFGTIWAQYVTGTFAYNASGTISIHPNNRNVTAYASLAYFSFIIPSNGHHPPYLRVGEAGISRVVSNGQSEDFDPPVQFILRSNVTEIRFRISSFDTSIKAVNVINYFE